MRDTINGNTRKISLTQIINAQLNKCGLAGDTGFDRSDQIGIMVKNVMRTVTDDDLRELFEWFGPITQLFILRDDQSIRSDVAIIAYQSKSDAHNAQLRYNRVFLYGSRMRISLLHSNEIAKLHQLFANNDFMRS